MKAKYIAIMLGAALVWPTQADAWNPFSKLKEKISGSKQQQAEKPLPEEAAKIVEQFKEGKSLDEINQELAKLDSEAGKYSIMVSNPEYEWSQFDSKIGKALLTDKGLEVESKVKDGSVMSTVELDFDPASDFTFGLSMVAKPEDDKFVGVVFDYKDNRNYKVFTVNKKQFAYYTVDDGMTAVVKQGLVKTGVIIGSIMLAKVGDKIDVTLNGIDAATLKKVNISSPNCGIIVTGKYKVTLNQFYLKLIEPDADAEQSTSDV